MFWLIVLVWLFVAGAAGCMYWALRKEHPDGFRRFEKTLGKTVGAAGKTTGRAAKAGATKAATAIAERAEQKQQLREPMRWYGANESLAVGRVRIPTPLTYAGNPREGWSNEPSAIDLTAQVSSHGRAESLPYWPGYSTMSPVQRHVYLSWMQTGRRRMPDEVGYAFVFFYGLERRALIDDCDHPTVAREVMRLRRLHADEPARFNRSFENYTSSCLWTLVASRPDAFRTETIRELMESVQYWSEDELGAALAWFHHHRAPLPDWAAFITAGELPGSQRSVVTQRVDDEFYDLFSKRYAERFGSGMRIEASERERRHLYRTASSAIGTCEFKIADPLRRASQFRSITDIWNACVDDLRKLSTVVRKEGEAEEITPAVWEALPEELRVNTDHPLTAPICRLIDRSTNEDAHCLLRCEDLASVLKIDRRDRYTIKQSRWMCATAEFVGYGLEPDARLTGSSYKADDMVGAFLRVTDETTEPQRYNAAACMLRLGLGIAASDGDIHPDEVALIVGDIERWFDLNDEEQRRIEALRNLLIEQGPDLKGVKRMTRDLNATQRQAIARMLLALIAEDGVITKDEIRAVRKCYRALEIDEQDVDDALERWKHLTDDDKPVVVGAAPPALPSERKGETIPAPPQDEKREFTLNREAIRAIEQETREAAALLAEAMNLETEPEADLATVDAAVSAVVVEEPMESIESIAATETGLPARYDGFYQDIIRKPNWNADDAEVIAQEHGVMLGAAVETINDWSYDRLDGPLLIHDGDELIVETELLDED